MASATMKSIECAGLVSNLLSSLDDVNSIASTFSKKVVARLPGFVIPRVPKEREDLHPGRHWHWNSFISKIKRISILSVLSGHVSKNIELRSAHESYLSGKSDSFLLIEGELSLLDGNYICEDEPRSLILRSGGTEQGFANRWKGHEKASLLDTPVGKQRRFSRLFPHKDIAANIDGRKGVFQDLNQRIGLGMERGKRDQILAMFDRLEQGRRN